MLNISGIRDQDKFEGSQELKVHPYHSSCSETTVFFKFAERKKGQNGHTFRAFSFFLNKNTKLKQALYSAFIQALINDVMFWGVFIENNSLFLVSFSLCSRLS